MDVLSLAEFIVNIVEYAESRQEARDGKNYSLSVGTNKYNSSFSFSGVVFCDSVVGGRSSPFHLLWCSPADDDGLLPKCTYI
jgi:hypothetical protein